MLLAIALQESRLEARRQHAGGPARGFHQFERNGIRALLKNPDTQAHLRRVAQTLTVLPNVPAIHRAVEFQDVLGCCCARLLLWALPYRLPLRDQEDEAWNQYRTAWQPGKPRRADWPENFARAWRVIHGE